MLEVFWQFPHISFYPGICSFFLASWWEIETLWAANWISLTWKESDSRPQPKNPWLRLQDEGSKLFPKKCWRHNCCYEWATFLRKDFGCWRNHCPQSWQRFGFLWDNMWYIRTGKEGGGTWKIPFWSAPRIISVLVRAKGYFPIWRDPTVRWFKRQRSVFIS